MVSVLGLFATGCSTVTVARSRQSAYPPAIVPVVKLEPQTIQRQLKLEAELQPFQEVEVHAKVAGYVKQMFVDLGSRVKQGDLLAILSVPELDHEREQASALVVRRQAEVVRAQQELKVAESSYSAIHLQANRLASLGGSSSNLVAQQEIDDAVSKDKAGEARISADRAALAAAQAALADARANSEKVRSLVAYSRITAPFSGVVSKRLADIGAMLPAGTSSTTQGQALVRLTQDDPLRLVIFVPESAVPSVRVGVPVRVRVPALGRDWQGVVARIAGALDPATRTMRVEVNVPNPTRELAPGEYAEADILLERREGALAVPLQAVLSPDRDPAVLVVGPGNMVERREVVLGLETATQYEIRSGLRPGERVVENPVHVKPGEAVEPQAPLAQAAAPETH
jgi:RND family efflux transporter MFP subunit